MATHRPLVVVAGAVKQLPAGDTLDATAVDAITIAGSKTTPVDADSVVMVDSAASNVLKKLTWANLKATAKTYFDTFYQAAGTYVTPTTLNNASLPGSFTTLATGGATVTGIAYIDGNFRERSLTVPASTISLAGANVFYKTVSSSLSWVFAAPAAGPAVNSFILDLTNGGTGTQTWPTGTKWASGTAPTLTASGRDVLGFMSYDGGTTWNGFLLAKDIR